MGDLQQRDPLQPVQESAGSAQVHPVGRRTTRFQTHLKGMSLRSNAVIKIIQVIHMCFKKDPLQRPKFDHITSTINQLLLNY